MTDAELARPARYFSWDEVRCQETGKLPEMTKELRFHLNFMDLLRSRYGAPIGIESWFRHLSHSLERNKDRPGSHSTATACDLRVSNGVQISQLLDIAYTVVRGDPRLILYGLGIGIKSRDSSHLLHIDTFHPHAARPALWTYA